MALVTVKPTSTDVAIARAIARNTEPRLEQTARTLTWGADEKILLVLAAAGWLGTRGKSEHLRHIGNHALLVTITASDGRGSHPRHFFCRQTQGRFPVRSRAAYGCACFGGRITAIGPPRSNPRDSGRALTDADRRVGALGQRRAGRVCDRSRHGTAAAPLDRVSGFHRDETTLKLQPLSKAAWRD